MFLKTATCNRFFTITNIIKGSHGLHPLVEDKCVESCQQTLLQVDCQNLLSTDLLYKLFQQVVTSLQMTSYNEPDYNRLV